MVSEDLKGVNVQSGRVAEDVYLAVNRKDEEIVPFRYNILHLRRQLFLVGHISQFSVENRKGRCVESIIGSANAKSSQRIRPGHCI